MTLAAAAVLSGVLALGAADATSAPDSLIGPGAEVPYVGQDPLLCGGASLAMVMRFWGARGVYAEDFRPLVRESEGGILTTDLVDAVEERGYQARVVTSRPRAVFDALARGIPSVLLLDGGGLLLHYVVLVQADAEDVWVHDPAAGPLRRLSREDLAARWSASGQWALLAGPPPAPVAAEARDTHVPDPSDGPIASAGERAVTALKAGDHAEARRIARGLLSTGRSDGRMGRRILATSYFLSGEAERALEEWNALGEPAVDLVNVHGLTASRHRVLARRMGIGPGELLTPGSMARARRRLAEEPTLAASRVEYRPNAEGTVEVHAFVSEHATVPTAPHFGFEVLRGLVSQEVRLDAGPLIGSADRWSLYGGWSPERASAGGRVRMGAAPLPGVASVGLDWVRERYAAPSGAPGERPAVSASRVRGAFGIHEWVDGRTRLGVTLGLERWSTGERLGSASASWHRDDGILGASARVDGWFGDTRSFWRGSLGLSARVPVGDHQIWRWTGGATATSATAPRMVWPGAGTGRVRPTLLRAYPLVRDGLISGPGFGRHLLHTSAEYRVSSRIGPLRAGMGLFADAAHLPRPASRDGVRTLADAGIEAFVDTGSNEVALSLAGGSEGWVLSARVDERW